MNFKELQELIRLVSKSDLSVFKYKDAETELTIKTGKPSCNGDAGNQNYQMPMVMPAPIAAPVQQIAPTAPTAAPTQQAPAVSASNYLEVKSPMVGTFYRAAGPDKAPFVQVGDSIEVGRTVCMIEAMKLFNEIESEVKGTIVKIMVEDATPVEFDQVLFLLEA